MYAQLGTITFATLVGPNAFSSTLKGTYPRHELIDGKPRLQRIGTDLEELDLSILFHSSFCDVQAQVNAINELVELGTPVPYTLGNGVYYGRFVIEERTLTVNHQAPNGDYIEVEMSLRLVEAASRPDDIAKASSSSFAAASSAPFASPFTAFLDGDAQRAGALVTSIVAEAGQVEGLITQADYNPLLANSCMEQAEAATDRQLTAIQQLDGIVNDTRSEIFAAATDLRNNLSAVNGAVTTLRTALAARDLVQALGAYAPYASLMDEMQLFSTEITILQAIRR